MDLITAAHAVASVLLILSGPRKVVDPAPSVDFLVGLGLPVGVESWMRHNQWWVGRAIGAFEMVLGLSALVIGGAITEVLAASTYLLFAALVMLAIRRGVDSCACFGRSDSTPSVLHVIIDLVLAAASFVAIAADPPSAVVDSDGFGGVVFVIGVGVAAGLTHAVLDGRLRPNHRR